jgi:phosphoribosylanthranilate isomerase
MFRIKICGITSLRDLEMVVAAGADAVGINFYAASPRAVSCREAASWFQSCSAQCVRVGVFVNHTLDEIHRTLEQVKLDVVQLHGDEPLDWIDRLAPWPVIRAVRRQPHESLTDVYTRLFGQNYPPGNLMAVLIDSAAPGQYGGSGKSHPWDNLGSMPPVAGQLPWILAGGLRPETVAEAISAARPSAVDVASGVERTPGVKSQDLVHRFIENARAAFARLTET